MSADNTTEDKKSFAFQVGKSGGKKITADFSSMQQADKPSEKSSGNEPAGEIKRGFFASQSSGQGGGYSAQGNTNSNVSGNAGAEDGYNQRHDRNTDRSADKSSEGSEYRRQGRSYYGQNIQRTQQVPAESEGEVNLDCDILNSPDFETFHINDLRKKELDEIMLFLHARGVEEVEGITKEEISFSMMKIISNTPKSRIYCEGVLEILQDGFGFIRNMDFNYAPRQDDIYVSNNQIKRFSLRTGDVVGGFIRPPKIKEKFFSLVDIAAINGNPHRQIRRFKAFDDLTPIYPQQIINLEIPLEAKKSKDDYSNRIIQLISPIGKGQRALIVAPPRTGKTILMQNIAHAISYNHPEVYLIYLGIDERPEEFTEMQRTIKGEVVSSTFDESSMRHVSLAEVVIGKAKRLVEQGRDVVILLDSITRLARAYNNVTPSSGKVLSGGVDSNALQLPKKFFGAARNIENGGSLTIIATALVDTGSRMDEVIFEEFKGTGNAEIVLDRKLADRRIFPSIDVIKSGTRKEDEMIEAVQLTKMWVLRRLISSMDPVAGIEFLIKKLRETKDNKSFFDSMNS